MTKRKMLEEIYKEFYELQKDIEYRLEKAKTENEKIYRNGYINALTYGRHILEKYMDETKL